MPSETKAGIGIVVVLLCAFGFITYTKYGQGLKDKTLAAIKGKKVDDDSSADGSALSEGEVVPDPPPAQEIPSAFDVDQRIAANEDEIFGQQQPEPSAAVASASVDEAWGTMDAQPAEPAPAQAQPAPSTDPFDGFENAAPATTQPATQTRVTQLQDPMNDMGDAFAQPAPTQPQQQPAAPADEFDPWGGDSGTAAIAATEPAAVTPRQPAPMESIQPQTNPVDAFEDAFEPEPQPAAQPQPQPVAIARQQPMQQPVDPFGMEDDIFGNEPAPVPASAPIEPARVAVTSQPEPFRDIVRSSVQQPDAFEDNPVNFEPEPVRRETFDPQPAPSRPERYDRDRRTDRVVSQPVPAGNVDYYTIREADTYWSISKKVYRTSRYYRALAKHNEKVIPDPRRMRPGTRLEIPSTTELERLYPRMLPGVRTASATRIDTRQPSGLYIDSNSRPVYRVGSADSLSRVAQRHLGRASRWTEIYDMNRDKLASPTSIRPGMLLAMPTDASQVSYGNR